MGRPGSPSPVALVRVSVPRERLERGDFAPQAVEVVGTAAAADYWEAAARALWEAMTRSAPGRALGCGTGRGLPGAGRA